MSMDRLFKTKTPVIPKRGVHLDLKGVPPTAQRLVELVKVFAAARYNVILVEWEDSFPWTVDERFRSAAAYTPEDIRRFCETAHDAGMELIPLVQCLGHMETPLRVPGYEHLREMPDNSSELNPCMKESGELVMKMVDDVLALMPYVERFHLGGDEAWHMGTHPDSKAFIEKHGKGALYMKHVGPILDHLNGMDVRPMLWHDMMIKWDDDALKRLASSADLVTWGYSEHPDVTSGHHNTKYIERFYSHGFVLWGGTIYKSSGGQNSDLPDIEKCSENALAWVDIAKRFDYAGVIATAWSRYSADRLQCEPIDSALDSLFNVGVILHNGALPEGGIDSCAMALEQIGEKNRFETCKTAMKMLTEIRCRAWRDIQVLREQVVLCRLDKGRRSSLIAEQGLNQLRKIVNQCKTIADNVRQAFAGLIDPFWIDEYLNTRLMPLNDELNDIIREMEA